MADIKILMGCIAVLAIGTFICTLVATASPTGLMYSPLQDVNRIVDFHNVTKSGIELKDVWGTWTVNNGAIYPTSFDFWRNNYALCEFGKKYCINEQISEKISVEGLPRSSTTDVWSINIFNSDQYGELNIEFRHGTLWVIETPFSSGIFFHKVEIETPFSIIGESEQYWANISYSYFINNYTLMVFVENSANPTPYKIYEGICDVLKDTGQATGNLDIEQEYKYLHDEINQTTKTRVGTNINTFKITGYIENTVSLDGVSYSYELDTNPLNFGNQIIGMMFYQVPVVNGEPLIPSWLWFFAIGLWELGIIAWIVFAIIEAIPL
jgi:hypothetical protein